MVYFIYFGLIFSISKRIYKKHSSVTVLKRHEITIGKYAAEEKMPAIRIGRVWRFDKDVIDG